MPFGIWLRGFHGGSDLAHSWVGHYVYLLGKIWEDVNLSMPGFVPDSLFFTWEAGSWQPMSYAQALSQLRGLLQVAANVDESSSRCFTLHSAKVTFLSFAHALDLPELWRTYQGHHKYHKGASAALYARDDVLPALRCQASIMDRVRLGWVPMSIQMRGGAPPILQHPITLLVGNVPTALAHPLFPAVPGGLLCAPYAEGAREAAPLPQASVQLASEEPGHPDCISSPRDFRSAAPATPAFLESSDEECVPSLGAPEEVGMLMSKAGVIHFALPDGGAACGARSALMEAVLEPPKTARFCQRLACCRLRLAA